MKTVKRIFMYACMAAAMVIVSCSAEDGVDGADGMDGIQGEMGDPGTNGQDGNDGQDGQDGQDGNDGNDGNDGQDGNANVISSGWIEFDSTVWTPVSSEFGVDYRNYPVVEPQITQEIVDDGVVLAYARFVITGTQTYMLPFTENITGADPAGQIITHRIEVSDFTIKMRNVSGAGDPGTFGGPGIAEYRYIIIPSLGATNPGNNQFHVDIVKQQLAEKGVDITNYNEVAAYYNLK